MKLCTDTVRNNTANMIDTLSYNPQPENWLYEIRQKGHDSTCYVMVPHARDLVKSHLMFAVREEVEVLKEKISELMEKINQLEVENTILKANASQETLTKLTTAAPTKTTHTVTNSNPTNGPIS